MNAQDTIDETELEHLVYEAIKGFGARGCISDELRAVFPRLSYSSVTARFFNLVEQKRVFRPGNCRPGKSGRLQQEMWADTVMPQLHVVADPDGAIQKARELHRSRIATYLKGLH